MDKYQMRIGVATTFLLATTVVALANQHSQILKERVFVHPISSQTLDDVSINQAQHIQSNQNYDDCLLVGGYAEAPALVPCASFHKSELQKFYYILSHNSLLKKIEGTNEIKSIDVKYLSDSSRYIITHSYVYSDIPKVYFNEKEIIGADPATFTLVGVNEFPKGIDSESKGIYYAKDMHSVYYKGEVVTGADSLSLKFIPTGAYFAEYVSDSSHVYYKGELIVGADPVTFKTFATQAYEGAGVGPYAVDIHHVYYGKTLISQADVKTFEVADNGYYGVDSTHVFDGEKLIVGADPKTYTFPESTYACLAGQTMILMSDGSQKKIEHLSIGDSVVSLDSSLAIKVFSKITHVIKRSDPIIIINERLKVAPDEVFYLKNGNKKEARLLVLGDKLFSDTPEGTVVTSLVRDSHFIDTYDLILEHGENFFADGYLVATPKISSF